jgi:hypothetical protein
MVGKISAEGANLIVAIYSHININRLSSIVSSSPVLQPRSLLVRTSTRMALFFSPFLCQGVGVLSKKRLGGGGLPGVAKAFHSCLHFFFCLRYCFRCRVCLSVSWLVSL